MWSFFTLIQTNHTRKKGTTRFAWVTPFISQNLGVTTANFLKFAWNHWLEGVLCGCFSINFCFIYPLINGDHKNLLVDPLVPQKMVKTPPPTQIMRVESLNLYFFLKILPIYKLDKLPFYNYMSVFCQNRVGGGGVFTNFLGFFTIYYAYFAYREGGVLI